VKAWPCLTPWRFDDAFVASSRRRGLTTWYCSTGGRSIFNGFNILRLIPIWRNLLASDLVAVFQRLSTSWGDQMNSVLQNAILAFLESDRRGTIADVRRFLIEPAFRNEFPEIRQRLRSRLLLAEKFSHLSGNKSIGSILTRLDTFLAQKPIRHMVSQRRTGWISRRSWILAKSFWRNCRGTFWAGKTHICLVH